MTAEPSEPNLAIIRLSSFGDIVLSEPVARAVKECIPGARLSFVTREEYAGVPALFGSVDRVIPFKRDAGIADSLAGDTAFDAVLDLQNNFRSRSLSRSLKAGMTVRYRRPVVRRLLLVKAPWLWRGELPHTIDLYAAALGRLGIEMSDRVPRVDPGQEARQEAAWRLGGRPLVAVVPGGSSEYKRWPESAFAALTDLIRADGVGAVIVGSDVDRQVVESVAGHCSPPVPPVEITADVNRLAAVFSLAGAAVTNDSGLMHLAAAAGSRVIALFGPTSAALGFALMGEGHSVLSLGVKCSPCSYHGNRPCRQKRRVCMEDLSPARVHSAVRGALEVEAADD